jgi:lipoate-protein ligase A
MQPVRLILDPPTSGVWNMALDEALLRSAADSEQATVRFYRWEVPTLSLGYFQSVEERRNHLASCECPLVRRSSGGGAIIHDRELTYSFATPIRGRFAQPADYWYDLFHSTLVDLLGNLGIAATRCPGTLREHESNFLCFQRRSAGDVLLENAKIAGSAQRRHARALLQHGSVLLARSTAAPELDGICELAGQDIDAEWLSDHWTRALADQHGLSWEPGRPSKGELQMAHQIVDQKFAAPAWTSRR